MVKHSNHSVNISIPVRYNAGDIPELACPDGTTGAPCKRSVQDKNVLYDNKLLGVARIRQVNQSGSSTIKHNNCSFG